MPPKGNGKCTGGPSGPSSRAAPQRETPQAPTSTPRTYTPPETNGPLRPGPIPRRRDCVTTQKTATPPSGRGTGYLCLTHTTKASRPTHLLKRSKGPENWAPTPSTQKRGTSTSSKDPGTARIAPTLPPHTLSWQGLSMANLSESETASTRAGGGRETPSGPTTSANPSVRFQDTEEIPCKPCRAPEAIYDCEMRKAGEGAPDEEQDAAFLLSVMRDSVVRIHQL